MEAALHRKNVELERRERALKTWESGQSLLRTLQSANAAGSHDVTTWDEMLVASWVANEAAPICQHSSLSESPSLV